MGHFNLRREIEKIPFSPSDWLIAGALGAIALFAAGWILAQLSLSFTVEVPARGGTYTEGIVGVPRFINPVLAISDADRDLVQLTFSGLMRTTPEGTLVPDLASGYTVSDDKKTYTFTIRDNAEFHDGTPITADDVMFTVLLAQNPAIKSPKRANWEGVVPSVIDEKTISFTLKTPYAPFVENTTLGILPKHLWESVSPEEFQFSTLNTNPIGTGPYKVDSVVTNASGIPSSIELSAFKEAVRRPYISYMTLTFFEDADKLRAAALADPMLGAHSLSPEGLESTHHIEEAVLGRIFGVFYNQNQNDLFADKEVRHALDTALDKQKIVSTLVAGYGSAIAGPLPPDSVLYTAASTSENRIDEARRILAADGWSQGSDGIFEKKLKKGSRRLSFMLATGNAPELKKAAELVAEEWRTLGVDVTTQFFEKNDLQQEVIRPRKYDALLFGLVVGRELDLFAFWHSSQRNDPGLNIGLYVNNAVDKKLEEARVTDDPQERKQKIQEAAAVIEGEWAATFLYAPHFIYAVPRQLKGVELGTITTPADRFANSTDWYLTTERVWPLFTGDAER